MYSRTWKKEKDLLSEAYQSVTESTHDSDAPALGPDEERQSDGSVKNTKTGETVYTPKDKTKADEAIDPITSTELANADRPSGDEELPNPGEQPDDGFAAQELDADVRDLISLIANPPPEEELTRLGYEGRLSEYVTMLQKKVDAAQAQLDLRQPAEDSGA